MRVLWLIVGLARTSTAEQVAGLEAQERKLREAGAERIFSEQASALGPRAALKEALSFVREGDVLLVCEPSRLARSVADLVGIVSMLQRKQVVLRILSMGVDTSTPTGKLMLNLLGAVAQFERELMLERQREGIAKAKREGRYKGRAPTAMAKSDEIIRMAASGSTREAIARQLGIGVASVYRALKAGNSLRAAETSIST